MELTDKLKQAENLNHSLFTEIKDSEFEKSISDDDDDFNKIADDFNRDNNQEVDEEEIRPAPNNPAPNYSFINSSVAIGVLDSVLPAAIVWAYGAIMDRRVNKSDFKLTADEKKTLDPIIAACLRTINIDLSNPFKALLIVGGMIYGGKIFTAEGTKIEKKEQGQRIDEEGKRGRGRPRKN